VHVFVDKEKRPTDKDAAAAVLQVPDDDAELDGEEMEQLHEEIEADYDAGDTIKTKLIPHAVAW
jgi:hypothetical protein